MYVWLISTLRHRGTLQCVSTVISGLPTSVFHPYQKMYAPVARPNGRYRYITMEKQREPMAADSPNANPLRLFRLLPVS